MVEWEFGAPLGSKLCVAVEVFKRDVLRIEPSDCHKSLSEPRIYVKEIFPRDSGGSTSRIRRSPGFKVRHMLEFEEFGDQRPLDKAQWMFQKQIRDARARRYGLGKRASAAIARQFYETRREHFVSCAQHEHEVKRSYGCCLL